MSQGAVLGSKDLNSCLNGLDWGFMYKRADLKSIGVYYRPSWTDFRLVKADLR